MKKAKILFVSQEIFPYLPATQISTISRQLPQGIQELGKEIRTFMPRYGLVNERRNQLHEVIRLSGMNVIVNNNDQPLIIKVASIQSARMQVYFIDNEEYFQRKALFKNPETNEMFKDNDERMIFFARGVIETVKKLGWQPDIIHCHGWFTSLLPLYIKTYYKDHPLFANTRVVTSVYDEAFQETLNPELHKKAIMENIKPQDVKGIKEPNYNNLLKFAIDYSDGVIKASPKIEEEIENHIKLTGKNYLDYTEEEYIKTFSDFYDEILEESEILV